MLEKNTRGHCWGRGEGSQIVQRPLQHCPSPVGMVAAYFPMYADVRKLIPRDVCY